MPPETTLQHIAAPDPAPGSTSSTLSQNPIGPIATAAASSTLLHINPTSVPAVTPGLIPVDSVSQMQSQTVIQPITTYVAAGHAPSTPSQTSAEPVPNVYTTAITNNNIPVIAAVLPPAPVLAQVAAESMLTMFAQSMDRELLDLRQFWGSDYFDDVNEVGIAEFAEELWRVEHVCE